MKRLGRWLNEWALVLLYAVFAWHVSTGDWAGAALVAGAALFLVADSLRDRRKRTRPEVHVVGWDPGMAETVRRKLETTRLP